MKSSIYFVFALILLSSCSDNTAEDNSIMIEKYIRAVEAKDYATMELLLADNYMGYGPSFIDSTSRENALATWKYNIENLYQSISYEKSRYAAVTIKDGPNQGNWVANWAELSINYKDGRGSVTIWANTNYQIEEGKIVKSYTFYNEADVLRQLGFTFIDLN